MFCMLPPQVVYTDEHAQYVRPVRCAIYFPSLVQAADGIAADAGIDDI